MDSSVDVVVVGGGIVGSAIAAELARRGLGVTVCEQDRMPGRGATTWSGGLVRLHHTAHCDTRLARQSLSTFQSWADVVGGDCGFRQTGFVVLVASRHRDRLARNVAAVNQVGGASEIVEVADLANGYPALAFDGAERLDLVAGYEPDAGYVDPRTTTISLVAVATRAGAQYREGVVVTGLVDSRGAVTGVETNVGAISAAVVVLATGAWSARLTKPVGLTLPVVARRIGLAHADLAVGDGDLPCGIDDTLGTYFRPSGPDGGLYFGVALHPEVTVDEHPDPVHGDELATARKTVSVRIPRVATAQIRGTRAGFDGYTPDRHPAIGAAGPHGLYLCTGFSGGGVKLAPAVAAAVAEEIVGGHRSEVLLPYRPQRFAAGALLESDFPYDYLS